MREKKTAKVGQSNGFWGLILAFAVPFFTITAMVPNAVVGEGMLAKVARVIKSHKPFFVLLGMIVVIGGVAIGRLLKGGRKLADAGEFSDLERL